MKLQNLTVIFIIIILPIVIVLSAYVGYEIKTINMQNAYNTGLQTATHDAIFSFEINTKNDAYSNNAENKRSNIKAAVKTFENSLSTACNLDLYNNEAIEEYIPAIVFGLYDGFYMYAPAETQEGKYKHNLRNYVYYSEQIQDTSRGIDIVIRYTLDNYVAVSGKIGDDYVTRAGYLINLRDLSNYNEETIDTDLEEIKYKVKNENITIKAEKTSEYVGNHENTEPKDLAAVQYYKDAYAFSYWFLKTVKIGNTRDYLRINNNNDPEDENSLFVQHKKTIIKEKIEETLNSSITAYANKTRNTYKMPKFKEEDWDKVYNNISVISFVQGMNIGFKNYNHYCILNSTNNQEYVNPNLIYFTDGANYHDIRCEEIKNKPTTGYKIGSFEKQTYEAEKKDEDGNSITDAQGNPVIENQYYYKHNELACYGCINGTLNTNKSVYDYVRDSSTEQLVKVSYFSALARERHKTTKLLNSYNAQYTQKYTVTYVSGEVTDATGIPEPQSESIGTGIAISKNIPTDPSGNKTFSHWESSTGGKYNPSTDENISPITGYSDITLTAIWNVNPKIKFYKNYSNSDNSYEQETKQYLVPYIIGKTITRSGYNFLGWNTERDGTGTTYTTGSTYEGNEDLNLYAQWQRNEVNIAYYADGEEISNDIARWSTYTVKDILDGNENYTGKMLLGYKVNNTGRVNYNGQITVSDYESNGNIRLDAIYIDSNSIKCNVSVASGTNNQYSNRFYTNTTENITAEITSENNNASPSITSSISGDNNSWSTSNNVYEISSTNEGSNTINASMSLSKDGVSRTITENFYIIVDRTAPVLNSAEYEYYWLRHTVVFTGTGFNRVRLGTSEYIAGYSYYEEDRCYRATGATRNDCENGTIILEDYAGNTIHGEIINGTLNRTY